MKAAAPKPPSVKAWQIPTGWACAALFLATLAVYLPALRAGLIWNDIDYITKPELRGLGGIWRIWTWAPAAFISGSGPGIGPTEQFYPLLHSFFWLQHKLWGDSALGYHVVNVLLHATAACLLAFVVERLLDRKTAWIAAALFALHPVMVESVAWISEQKNTLSTVFYLLAALVYLRWDEGGAARPVTLDEPRRRDASRHLYVCSTLLFLCALFSKSLTASLPAALLVVIWWKRGKIAKRDVLPLIPWFVVGAAVGLFTGWVERNFVGAQGADFGLGVLERGLLSGHVIWFYIGKLAWPAELIFIYPRWTVSASDWTQWLYPIGAIALAACLFALRKKSRAPLAAYLYFVGTLVPTIGFFNVFAFKFSFVADHWVYLPALGVFVLAGGGISKLVVAASVSESKQESTRSRSPLHRIAVAGTCIVLIGTLGALSHAQTKGYRDMETFYRTILADNADCWLALNNLGKQLLETGRPAEAAPYFEKTIALRPKDAEPNNGLGVTYQRLGRDQEAAEQFAAAIQKLPNYAEAHYNLGNLLFNHGQFTDAEARFKAAVAARPRDAGSRHNLGATYLQLNRTADAIESFLVAIQLRPVYPLAHANLGAAYVQAGRYQEAVDEFNTAIGQGLTTPDIQARLADAQRQAARGTQPRNPNAPVRIQGP